MAISITARRMYANRYIRTMSGRFAQSRGLDRLDNALGYTLGNVRPCCWICNRTRGHIFTPSEMEQLGKIVAKIQRAREEMKEQPWH